MFTLYAHIRNLALAFAAVAASLVGATGAQAQPLVCEGPVLLVVPFSAGGGTDLLARLLSASLKPRIDQTVVVDNKPGANGVIASQYVERAKPNGCTLMLGSSSTHVIAPLLSSDKNALEGVRKNFAMLTILADTPLVFAVNEKSHKKTLEDLLADKSDKGLTFGTFGANSSPHLMGTLLAVQAGIRLIHVPYKGSASAVVDLISGNIDSVFLTVAAVSTHVEAHQLRALAITGTERLPMLPGVPTFLESGVAGLENSGWFAVFAPAGTPVAVLTFLRTKINEVMLEPSMQAKFPELGLQASKRTPEQEAIAWDQSIASMRETLQRAKIDLTDK